MNLVRFQFLHISQVRKLCHILKKKYIYIYIYVYIYIYIVYLYVAILCCIPLTRQKHVPIFSVFTSRSYFVFILWFDSRRGPRLPRCWGLEVTLRHITIDKTPLDEWSARLRELYLTTHKNHNPQISMSPAGFEPVILAGDRSQTEALKTVRSPGSPDFVVLSNQILCFSLRCVSFSAMFCMLVLWNVQRFNPLNPELNPICYLLALLGAHHFLHVSGVWVKSLTLRRLMSCIYGVPILDVSRSHTTTQHSR